MDRKATKAEVKAELRERSEDLTRRVDALEQEVTRAGTSIREYLRRRPLQSLGGALLAGLAVGFILMGRWRRKGRLATTEAHAALVEQYLDAVGQEVRRAVASGEEVGRALRQTLRDRVPLIVYRQDGLPEQHGALREGLDLVGKTALSWAVKEGIDRYAARFLMPRGAAHLERAGDDLATVGSAVSEATDED